MAESISSLIRGYTEARRERAKAQYAPYFRGMEMIIAGEKKKKQDLATYEAIVENVKMWDPDYTPPLFKDVGNISLFQNEAEAYLEKRDIESKATRLGIPEEEMGKGLMHLQWLIGQKEEEEKPKEYRTAQDINTGEYMELWWDGKNWVNPDGEVIGRSTVRMAFSQTKETEPTPTDTTESTIKYLNFYEVPTEGISASDASYKFKLLNKLHDVEKNLQNYRVNEEGELTAWNKESLAFTSAYDIDKINYKNFKEKYDNLHKELYGDQTEEKVDTGKIKELEKELKKYHTKGPSLFGKESRYYYGDKKITKEEYNKRTVEISKQIVAIKAGNVSEESTGDKGRLEELMLRKRNGLLTEAEEKELNELQNSAYSQTLKDLLEGI